MGTISNIDPFLRERAEDRCEYCHFPLARAELPFEIDHIMAKKHGGGSEPVNLAVACFFCNRYKGSNIAGIDPQTDEIVRLFHPRRDRWQDHFQWEHATLSGRTAVGRATIRVLEINHPDAVAGRESMIREGVFPG